MTTVELAVAPAESINHFYNAARRHGSFDRFRPNGIEELRSSHTRAAFRSATVSFSDY